MNGIDSNTFAVKVHGNSMLPKIEDGDTVVVVPSRNLEHGCVCYVSELRMDCGERIIRRYNKYGDMVILKPDNPAEGFEIVINGENADKYNVVRVTKIINNC